MLIEVEDHPWVHRVHLVVVIVHPLEEDRLGDGVDVTLAHGLVHCRLVDWHAWKRLEVLRSDTIQEVDSENLIEDSDPRLHR